MAAQKPVPPRVETAHDVRKLRACSICESIGGDEMVRISDAELAHAFCVVKTRGLDALAALSSKEIGKIRMSEIRGLGLDADRIFELLDAAEQREAQAT